MTDPTIHIARRGPRRWGWTVCTASLAATSLLGGSGVTCRSGTARTRLGARLAALRVANRLLH